MLSAYLFDEQEGKKLETWVDAVDDVREGQLLWLDLAEASADEKREVGEALGLDEVDVGRFRKGGVQAALVQGKGYLRVTAVAVGETKSDAPPQTVALDCFVGENWVVTAHDAGAEALDGFRDRVEGEGALGVLDAPSFLAELLEWVVTGYLRAFDQVEADLEEFDVRVLGSVQRDSEREIGELIDARRRVGRLRRALAPHREVFAALCVSAFDPISTEESAQRFGKLAARTETAVSAAQDARNAVIGSFDVLIARTGHRTNEIVKVLTLASILLLPGALIAGVMGMNFHPSIFQYSFLFWVVNGVIVLIALATLAIARVRRWI